MKKKRANKPKLPRSLRERAEAGSRATRTDIARMSAEEIQRLVHELQVRQLELEMQNEELRRAHAELERRMIERTAELHESERSARAVVDALTAHIAIVDERGSLLAVNARWREFAKQNRAPLHRVCEGANYLAVCDAAKRHDPDAAMIAAGIRAVLAGTSRGFATEYPCHSETEKRWFIVRVTPFSGEGPRRAVISHENITARAVAEQSLRASEERYRQLIHALPVALYTCDTKGRILLYNAAAVKMWGREPRPGRHRWGAAHRLFTPDGKRVARARRPMAMTVKHGEPLRDVELIVERPDGTRSHILSFPDPIRDGSGAVTGAVNVLVDITALKMAENALRTTERQLRTLSRVVEQSPSSVLITTPTGEIDYVNPAFTELTGYSLAEVMGKNPRLLNSGEHSRKFYKELWQTITAGRVWRGEICNRKKNGELFWELTVIAPIDDEQGNVTHFVSIKEDITEQRRAAAKIHQSEERLRAILNTVHDAIVTIDQRGIIVGVNPATTRMFGYNEAELIGQNVKMLMPSPYREEHDGYLANYHRTGQARIIGIGREAQAQRKNGSVFPIELAVSEVDHMHLFTGVIRDITERKRLEAEVLAITEDERLRVAADLHDGICQELVGTHYIAAGLLQDLEGESHRLAKQARWVHDAIVRTTEHTRQVARGMAPVVADGTGLMQTLQRFAVVTARTHRIRCALRCREIVLIAKPTVANELYHIAKEATHNAVSHGRATGITIRLSDSGGEVRLTVADNGCGLPADVSGAPGMGLRLMRYRAGLIGGELIVQPRRRGGTEVICRIRKPTSEP